MPRPSGAMVPAGGEGFVRPGERPPEKDDAPALRSEVSPVRGAVARTGRTIQTPGKCSIRRGERSNLSDKCSNPPGKCSSGLGNVPSVGVEHSSCLGNVPTLGWNIPPRVGTFPSGDGTFPAGTRGDGEAPNGPRRRRGGFLAPGPTSQTGSEAYPSRSTITTVTSSVTGRPPQ